MTTIDFYTIITVNLLMGSVYGLIIFHAYKRGVRKGRIESEREQLKQYNKRFRGEVTRYLTETQVRRLYFGSKDHHEN